MTIVSNDSALGDAVKFGGLKLNGENGTSKVSYSAFLDKIRAQTEAKKSSSSSSSTNKTSNSGTTTSSNSKALSFLNKLREANAAVNEARSILNENTSSSSESTSKSNFGLEVPSSGQTNETTTKETPLVETTPVTETTPETIEDDNSADYIEYTYQPGDTFWQVIRNLGLDTDAGLWGAGGDVEYYTQQLRDQGIYGNIPIGTTIRLIKRNGNVS